MKIILNEAQARTIKHALEMEINDDFGMKDSYNRHVQGIINKISKALGE